MFNSGTGNKRGSNDSSVARRTEEDWATLPRIVPREQHSVESAGVL